MTRRQKLVVGTAAVATFLVVGIAIARADDWKSWVEPPLGSISATGTSIEVENYRCTVTSPRTIQCLNVGRACVASRAEEDARSAKTFGCAIEGNKNYPCPKDQTDYNSPAFKKQAENLRMCSPMMFGGM